MKNSHVAAVDPEVHALIEQEEEYQASTIRLIASENYQLAETAEAVGCVFSNKYSEGYPHKWKKGELVQESARYYRGHPFTDKLERLAIDRCLDLFLPDGEDKGDYHVNVQPLSGAPANLATIAALAGPGGTILGLMLPHGGHLTHGHNVSITGKFFNAVHYPVGDDGLLDYDTILNVARESKPQVIICGFSAYSRIIDFKAFGEIARQVGAYLLADISHIGGLVASGVHPSPLPHADVVMCTTHKTLRGPRGAFLLCKKSLGKKIDAAVFPFLQGGPHMNSVAAMATTFKLAALPEFREYSQQVVNNAKQLASDLASRGFEVLAGGTENHMVLVDITRGQFTDRKLDGDRFSQVCEDAGLIFNKNSIPGDTSPLRPSGFRVGTAAITTIGMKEPEMDFIAESFRRVAEHSDDPSTIASVRDDIGKFMLKFPPPQYP